MAQYTLIAVAGLIVLLLGTLAFASGLGQLQAKGQFEDRLSDDRTRFDRTNASGGYEVCAFSNETASLDCPENPYTGSFEWILGGLVSMAAGAGVMFYDVKHLA